MKKFRLIFWALCLQNVAFGAMFNNFDEKSIDLNELKSPFVNPSLEYAKALKIGAILLNKVKINDKWYKENEMINGALIKKIKAGQIVLEINEQEFIINANKNEKISIN